MHFSSPQPIWAPRLNTKIASLSRVCISVAYGIFFIFSFGCDSKSTVRAVGGKQNPNVAEQLTKQKDRTESPAHIETETIDQADALATKASLEYMESTRSIALLLNYLSENEVERKKHEPEIKWIAAKSEKDPFTVQIVQSQSSSAYDISSDQSFAVQSNPKADGKINFDQMKVQWLENVKLDKKSIGTALEIRHEFELLVTQEFQKDAQKAATRQLNITAKDAKILIAYTKEKLNVEVIADLNFTLQFEEPGKAIIKDLKIEKTRMTSQDKTRSRFPVLSMGPEQSLVLQLKSATENPKSMSSICYDIEKGSFTSGDDKTSITSSMEANRVTLKTKAITLPSCPTANFIDASKWIPSEGAKRKTTNLKAERDLELE